MEILRWILILPSVYFVYTLTSVISEAIQRRSSATISVSSISFHLLFFFVGGILYITIGILVTPSNKKLISIVLLILIIPTVFFPDIRRARIPKIFRLIGGFTALIYFLTTFE